MNTPETLTIQCQVHLDRRGRGAQKQVLPGPKLHVEPGRVPRLSRLMAVAIRCEQLLRDGEVANHAELAVLGEVSRPRITQILNLLHLAPDIQDAILHLPRTQTGRDPILLRDLQPIAAILDWADQRRVWVKLYGQIRRRQDEL